MVDQNTIFGGMLTNLGAAKKTNCDALGIPWEPRYMLIGDANGTDPVPNPAQTQLVHQVYRAQLNQLYVSPADDKVLVAELVLPPDVGGWWVRELALEDKDGVFSAVANVAPSYKPQLAQNSGRNQVVRMHIITNGTANIQLKIDPSVVLATREYVDTRIMEELYKLDSKQSVRVATTADIALAGLQTIDTVALVAGDRVLVKNQAVAKDNGLYIVAAGVWKRSLDADTSAEVTSALLVSVEQGAMLADTRWQLVTDGVIVLGTTALTFQNVTQGFAPINSPALQGIPTSPTPPQFDSSTRHATTEFVRRALGSLAGYAVYNANTVLTANDVGKYVYADAATITLTLPDAALLPAGCRLYIQASANSKLTVTSVNGNITGPNGNPMGSPNLTLSPGVAAEFISWGAGWLSVGGTGLAALTDYGYQNFSGGLIIQWGMGTGNASGTASITFPIKFPNACRRVLTTPRNNAAFNATSSIGAVTAQGVTIYTTLAPSGQPGVAQPLSFDWLAIGH